MKRRRPKSDPPAATLTPHRPEWLQEKNGAVLLALQLQPRASRNEILAGVGECLRIRVTAPPVENAANRALLALLAATLGCARNRIRLVSGPASRRKRVAIDGVPADVILSRFGYPTPR